MVLHLCDVLTSQMVHFIHQLAYYITFEVSWRSAVHTLTDTGCPAGGSLNWPAV